ncbi:ABC transporter permease [Notoacmeibacter marinus]|uniref:ABC transporter permease n=1 Tax=Notoacmeibacter marinus TaxID=1876515 RepID=A0A231UX22_9HYPH|nr:ABC transporter permease [Notoacmeibacter marinus]OXT00444.1 ABC transporter permease [Notoacmeibacter marinus]
MLEAILISIATAATPLFLAAIGELVSERAGVLNLGVEGMMAMGAVTGFGIGLATGSPLIGALAAVIVGAVFSLLFAFLTLTLASNQVATGLALTLLGLGVSGQIGEAYVGQPGVRMGPVFLGLDPIFWFSLVLLVVVAWFLFHTKPGLKVRAVGDSHVSAHALGVPVIAIRYAAVAFGGACAGLAGAYLSLVYTPQWVEAMTAGRGWIALALVVFASWRPVRVLVGAWLFGAITIGQLQIQAMSLSTIAGFAAPLDSIVGALKSVPSQFLSSLPYLATVVVLVLISRNRRLALVNTPACLGQPFVPDR